MIQRQKHDKVGRLVVGAGGPCADMLYASGFKTPDPYLWFSAGGTTAVVVNPLEVGRARVEVKEGIEVLSREQAQRQWCGGRKGKGFAHLIAGLSRQIGVWRWRVPADFPLGLARELEEKKVRFQPVSPFFPERRCKSEDEIEKIRQAIGVVEAALQRAFDIIARSRVERHGGLRWRRCPLTAEVLRSEMDVVIARRGGSTTHTIAAPGVQGAEPHLTGHGPIMAGEPVVMDIFPCIDRTGYHGDVTRTVVKGRAPVVVKRAFAAVREARDAAIKAVRAGVKTSAVHRVAARCLRHCGFSTRRTVSRPFGFIHGVGHGVGLEVHETPYLSRDTGGCLEAGDVIAIEPGVYYPEWGGVRLEDVVVVRDRGCRNLTRVDTFLEIP